MKIILIVSLVLVIQLLKPLAANTALANVEGPTLLWLAVSLLAISRMGGQAKEPRRANPVSPNPLRDSSFSDHRFFPPNHPLQ